MSKKTEMKKNDNNYPYNTINQKKLKNNIINCDLLPPINSDIKKLNNRNYNSFNSIKNNNIQPKPPEKSFPGNKSPRPPLSGSPYNTRRKTIIFGSVHSKSICNSNDFQSKLYDKTNIKGKKGYRRSSDGFINSNQSREATIIATLSICKENINSLLIYSTDNSKQLHYRLLNDV